MPPRRSPHAHRAIAGRATQLELPAPIPDAPAHPAPTKTNLDGWLVPPETWPRRKRGRGSGRRTGSMAQPLIDLVEQFCTFQRKQRGKTEGGVKTYRWNLGQYLEFVAGRRPPRRASAISSRRRFKRGWIAGRRGPGPRHHARA